jgi:hypothetical protein
MGNVIASAADVSHFFWDLLGPRPRLGLSAGTLKEMLDMQILDLVRGESRGEESRAEQRRGVPLCGFNNIPAMLSLPAVSICTDPSSLVCIVPSPR